MCKMDSAAYVFPAVRGTQAQREYYISMVPLDVMSKIFQFADEDLPPEIRAQRILNKSRIPEIREWCLSAYGQSGRSSADNRVLRLPGSNF